MHARMHAYACVRRCAHACMRLRFHTCRLSRPFRPVRPDNVVATSYNVWHACIRTYMRTYTRTYTHTTTTTRVLRFKPERMCAYSFVYACTHATLQAYMHCDMIYIYIRKCVFICICICMPAYSSADTYVHLRLCTHTCTFMYMRTYVYTHSSVYARMHIRLCIFFMYVLHIHAASRHTRRACRAEHRTNNITERV
jgi:hypothetical protein